MHTHYSQSMHAQHSLQLIQGLEECSTKCFGKGFMILLNASIGIHDIKWMHVAKARLRMQESRGFVNVGYLP